MDREGDLSFIRDQLLLAVCNEFIEEVLELFQLFELKEDVLLLQLGSTDQLFHAF